MCDLTRLLYGERQSPGGGNRSVSINRVRGTSSYERETSWRKLIDKLDACISTTVNNAPRQHSSLISNFLEVCYPFLLLVISEVLAYARNSGVDFLIAVTLTLIPNGGCSDHRPVDVRVTPRLGLNE